MNYGINFQRITFSEPHENERDENTHLKKEKKKLQNFKRLSIEAEALGPVQCRSIDQSKFYRDCHS